MTFDGYDPGPEAAAGSAPGAGTVDVLASEPGTGTAHRRPWWLVGGAAVVVAALIGGVAYGAAQLSGGGSQPEDALPAGAFAFVKVDLDPPARQKIDAVRFLRAFPALEDKIGPDSDLRRVLFEGVAQEAGWGALDFDSDVGPWLGQRIGLAVYPPVAPEPGGAAAESATMPVPRVVAALQVTDEGAAERGLARLVQAAGGAVRPGFVVTGDYALLAETQQAAEQAARKASSGSLAAAGTFAADLAAQEDGVAAAWVDADAAGKALGPLAALGGSPVAGLGLGGLPGTTTSGRSTFVVRFDGPDVLEVTGTVTGAQPVPGIERPVSGFTELPASSAVAVGLTDGDDLVTAMFETLGTAFDGSPVPGAPSWEQSVAAAERELGVELPEDLAVLLGSNLVAALDADGLDEGTVTAGARVTTDARRASAVLDKIERAARRRGEGPLPVVRRETDDGLVVASSPGFAARLTQQGDLGDSDAFRRALPDVDNAGFALWLDVRALVAGFGGEPDENVDPIDGIGATAVSDGEGSATYRLRLVVS